MNSKTKYVLTISTFAFFNSIPVFSENTTTQFEEIMVIVGEKVSDDSSLISPDAESLLSIAGDVNDPLKAILSLPGITFGGSDLDEPIIRGGSPKDNLFLIDGIPVKNVFHELSDSIISPNVIKTFDLYSAAFSPQYGGATGGVINIGLRDPSESQISEKLDLSQLKSGFLYETPLTDNLAAYVTYRHNLAHLFLEEFERGNDALVFKMPESRDYTSRFIWRENNYDVTLTALGSWDQTEEVAQDENLSNVFGTKETRKFDAQSIRIRAELSPNTHHTTSISHSKTEQEEQEVTGNFTKQYTTTFSVRSQLLHEYGRHKQSLGVNLNHISDNIDFQGAIILCDKLEDNCGNVFSDNPTNFNQDFQVTEIYAEDHITVNTNLSLDVGIHGAIDHFLDKTYFEPRIGMLYQVAKGFGLYSRVGLHHASPEKQKLLLLNRLAKKQESEQSRQYLVGQKWEIATGWRLQTEVWFKDFVQTEFLATPIERKLKGTAYGFDLLLAKPISERLYGWLALSSSDGSFKDPETRLEVDNPFTPSLSATIAMNYVFDNGWEVGTKYRFQSGDLYTPLLSTTIEPVTGQPQPVFGKPFSAQLNDYRRLDIRIGKTSYYSSTEVLYYVDILNIMDRKNAANRTFPIRNTVVSPSDPLQATILPNDDDGIPLFIALGVNISF